MKRQTSKNELFIQKLKEIVGKYGTDTIKYSIGDSTANNRTLTVKQIVRFLTGQRSKKLKNLGLSLDSIYSFHKSYMYATRFNCRTDSLDLSEFFKFFDLHPFLKKSLGRKIKCEL